MFCTNCGAEISDEACYCGACGTKINSYTTNAEEIKDKDTSQHNMNNEFTQIDKKELKESAHTYLELFGAILLVLFLLGFLDEPIAALIQSLF